MSSLTGTATRFGRCYDFTAAHRLNCAAYSAEDNHRIYGKCNNPAGHGHNYRCTVIVEGEPDPVSGMVINMVTLDTMAARIIADYDYHHLDLECPDFAGRPSTAENITAILWKRFTDELRPYPHVRLHKVAISETRNNKAAITAN